MNEKRCIFHVPNYIDPKALSGSSLRPRKMLEGFEANGYHVDFVMGYGKERKKQIKNIENNIRNGITYDFMYSESSTMPTLLTEKNHLPRYPMLDFHFMKFCKKNDIKIGLFYRDVYWKFDTYKKEVPFLKRIFALPFYRYDLKKYDKLLDILYLPSNKMRPYVNVAKKYRELPPGCEHIVKNVTCTENDKLSLFYVGGVGDIYNLTKLFQAISELDFVHLTVCCRENEWQKEKIKYEDYLDDNITVVHKSGKDLEEFYKKADLCMLFFESKGYRSFAMPIKLFEYLGHECPIIATNGAAAGEFVEENDLGWSIDYDVKQLKDLLTELYHNKDLISTKNIVIKDKVSHHTWSARAEQVIQDLTKGE